MSYDDGGVSWDGGLGELDAIDGPKMDEVDLARLALAAVERDDDSSGQPGSGPNSRTRKSNMTIIRGVRIVAAPCCGARYAAPRYLSMNFMASEYWTDGSY